MYERKMTRRSFLKKVNRIWLLIISLSSIGYFYSRYVEPKGLDFNIHDISDPNIPLSFDGMKVIQFSDIHLGHNYTLDQLAKLVNQMNDHHADVVLFTGDLIDAPDQYESSDHIAPILKQIKAPFGKFAIYGNHDHGGYGTDSYRKIMEDSGFTVLMNDSVPITSPENESIIIAGMDDAILGSPDTKKTFHHSSIENYTIFLVHEPDIMDQLMDQHFSLQLSGHSHGGQVKLPFIGPIITPPGANKYYEGFYRKDGKTLYVNRGIGTTRMPYRFLSPPEVTVFRLHRK